MKPETIHLFEQIQKIRPARLFVELEEAGRGMGFILFYLHENPNPVTPGDLSRQSGVSTARIARLLKSMEEKGLIRREPSEKDGRSIQVTITPKGERQAEACQKEALEKLELLIASVGYEDMEQLIRICQKIADCMEEAQECFSVSI